MTISQKNLLDQVLDYSNRANPYPLYARMREHPVFLQNDGRYIVSTFNEVRSILQDPRFSVDMRKSYSKNERGLAEEAEPGFVRLDPPRHDWLRAQVMKHFNPELITGLQSRMEEIVQELLDQKQHDSQMDIVDDFAYPLPVTIICEILGVPREDEPMFHEWTTQLIKSFDLSQKDEALREEGRQAMKEMRHYLGQLIDHYQRQPGPGLLSAIMHDDTREKHMSRDDMVATAQLLLIAGHETTVNLITNSMLTLLRNPASLEKLRRQPEIVTNLIEEVLRFEPPVQHVRRTPLSEVTVAGVTIPQGAPVILVLASANRDPQRYENPDQFNPERPDIEHLSFGNGIHYCVGAPLARIETNIALRALSRRLQNPRLLKDPPPYRSSSLLRGPRHLPVSYERIVA